MALTSYGDRDHFDEYRPQTAVKHAVLAKYLRPYFDILKGWQSQLLYIDAFAGPGFYTDRNGTRVPGSPIRALDVVTATDRFRDIVRFIFAEPDSKLFAQLKTSVDAWKQGHPDVAAPILRPATFTELVEELKATFGVTLDRLPPAFLFVDPCGVSGVSMRAISTIASRQYCEVFVFFNVSGLMRVLGAGLDKHSTEMFGDEQSAKLAVEAWKSSSNAKGSCEAIVQLYRASLQKYCNLTHVCPFRIEYEGREGTSHYLIHASRHGTAFKIMKDIMWDMGSGEGLEFRHGREHREQESVLFMEPNEVDQQIADALKDGKRSVKYFCTELPTLPANMVAGKYYKERLLVMEREGRIKVTLDGKPSPSNSRRKIKGAATLSDRYDVELLA